MKRKQKRNNRKVRRRATSIRKNQLASKTNLPSYPCDITVTKTIRYVVTSSGHNQIKFSDILNLIVVPSSATAAYCLLKAAKIFKISVWAVDTTASSPLGVGNEVIITWLASLGKEKTDRGSQMGIEPAFVSSAPPKDSLSSFWCNTTTVGLTSVIVDIFTPSNGSIVDITYGLQFCNDQPARSISISSGVLGEVSYNNLTDYSNQGYQDYAP